MKTNKKTFLGFAMAMIFSLALMQGVATTSDKQDITLQQVSLGALYMAGETEGGASNVWGGIAAGSGASAWQLATGGTLLGWSPVGWALWGSAGVLAL